MPKFKMIIIGGMEIDELSWRDRWLVREHAPETISWIGPWLERYVRYWSVMAPAEIVPDLVSFGSYTTGVTMHVYNDYPPGPIKEWRMVARIPTKNQPSQTFSPGSASLADEGKPVTSMSCFVPFQPTEDLMGGNLVPWDTSILRWFTGIKYPKGVTEQEGEDWYLNTHTKEVMQQPGLLRYFSYKTMDFAVPRVWHRITEQWYADYRSWHKAVIDNPPPYTKPAWAKYDKYPFFEPNRDFLGTFILERPTHDLLKDYMGYVIGP
jgi:hypothetical protein